MQEKSLAEFKPSGWWRSVFIDKMVWIVTSKILLSLLLRTNLVYQLADIMNMMLKNVIIEELENA